jgi:hypothetical protein
MRHSNLLPLQSLKARARPENYQEDVNEKGLSDYSDPVAVIGVGGCTEQLAAVHNTGYKLAIAKFAEYNQLANHYQPQQLDTEHLTLEHLAVELLSIKLFAVQHHTFEPDTFEPDAFEPNAFKPDA